MGTVGYMSPEQVKGLPVDHRSDIFSFGTILYEMLSGKKAFRRDTKAETMAAIMRDEPPELTESGRNVSPALDHIVKHCLEKDRDNRFQSAKDVAFALSEASSSTTTAMSGAQLAAPPAGRKKVLIAVAAVIVLAAAGFLLLRRPQRSGGEVGGIKRVAVLPFENLGAPEDDYFADGIADAVRGKLTSLPGLQVIARASSTPYKKTTKTPQEIARELDAHYLLTATVRWQKSSGGNRVQVSPELVEIQESGAPASKWQQPFDAALTDVFGVQSEIAAKVAQALGGALGASEEKRLSEKPTQNLAAYDAFLKGEERRNSMAAIDPPSLRKALGFYDQAVALDPGFAQAWARVSDANSLLYANSTPTPALAERARQAAEKAVALAPNRPEGYQALGNYERLVSADSPPRPGAVREGVARCARRCLPPAGNGDRRAGSRAAGMPLWNISGRQSVSIPGLPASSRALATRCIGLRRYPEAREALDRGLALAPATLALIESKAMTFLAEGDLAGARAVIKASPREVEPTALVTYLAIYWDLVWVLDEEQRELLLRLTPSAFDDDRGNWALCLVQAYAMKGDAANVRTHAEEARKAFEEQLRAAPNDASRHAYLGLALAYLGRKEEAIREGERGAALDPVSKDASLGPYYQHQLARIYILVGEPEKALDQLEPLLKIPYFLSPGWLKIDPNFDPLRKNPRFQKLVAGTK